MLARAVMVAIIITGITMLPVMDLAATGMLMVVLMRDEAQRQRPLLAAARKRKSPAGARLSFH
jgi:hypothetical protein